MFVRYCKTIQQTGIGKPIMQCDFLWVDLCNGWTQGGCPVVVLFPLWPTVLEQIWGRGVCLLVVTSLSMGLACSINLWLLRLSYCRAKRCTWSSEDFKAKTPLAQSAKTHQGLTSPLLHPQGTLQAPLGLFHQRHRRFIPVREPLQNA